jgi:DHA3 family macrolide efflux protein-like MFS transporter
MFISGIFMPEFGTAETVLVQQHVEESMLGRVFSMIQIIASSAMPLGMGLFGLLGDAMKIEYILIGSGLLIIALSLYILFNKPLLQLDAPKKSE